MISIKPEAGLCIIFNQKILYEGTEVTEGKKYFIRTDIEYDMEKYYPYEGITKQSLMQVIVKNLMIISDISIGLKRRMRSKKH